MNARSALQKGLLASNLPDIWEAFPLAGQSSIENCLYRSTIQSLFDMPCYRQQGRRRARSIAPEITHLHFMHVLRTA